MLVYGRNVCREFLEKGKDVEKIIIQEGFDDKNTLELIENGEFVIETLKKREIDRLCDGVHQGIILFVADYKYYNIDDIKDDSSFIVILDHLEDPHNLGAIIRTCEAAGVDYILLPKNRQVQVNSTVMKTSVGTVDNVKLVSVSNLVNAINKLKKMGYWIVGTALEDSVDFKSIDYSGKIGLVIGNEGNGISRLVRESCDFIAKIPMFGSTNSLNASVAAGVMIYEVIRDRK